MCKYEKKLAQYQLLNVPPRTLYSCTSLSPAVSAALRGLTFLLALCSHISLSSAILAALSPRILSQCQCSLSFLPSSLSAALHLCLRSSRLARLSTSCSCSGLYTIYEGAIIETLSNTLYKTKWPYSFSVCRAQTSAQHRPMMDSCSIVI